MIATRGDMLSFLSLPATQSPTRLTKKKPLPSILPTLSYISNPWHEELTNFLVDQAVSLLVCKYKFEYSLNKQLGFVSFPVTEALMDILLGFKKVKGTHIRLSSDINWSCLLRKLEQAELAQEATRHTSRPRASQPSASHIDTSHHSTETPSGQPEPTDDSNQDQGTESSSSLHSELPIHQLLNPWDLGTAQEQTSRNLSESKLSKVPSSRIDMSKEMVNMDEQDDDKGSEEDEDRGSEEEEDEDRGGEEEDKVSYEDEHTSPSFSGPELENLIDQSVFMGPGDHPPRSL
ncbi:coiled-coil domain-containing protein 116-like [Nannospalax galili]|uniref:coiled-coil domain-containing protein 116-like n=1 Tax=Nannospalax galili TaxID=1026970 RepID=UPI00111C7574|nr:coiled-coil domain-containing protein 116-like [Nannospalax galili]